MLGMGRWGAMFAVVRASIEKAGLGLRSDPMRYRHHRFYPVASRIVRRAVAIAAAGFGGGSVQRQPM